MCFCLKLAGTRQKAGAIDFVSFCAATKTRHSRHRAFADGGRFSRGRVATAFAEFCAVDFVFGGVIVVVAVVPDSDHRDRVVILLLTLHLSGRFVVVVFVRRAEAEFDGEKVEL